LGIAAPGQLWELLTASTDVLHVHAFGYPPTWFGRLVGALRDLPRVVTPHVDEGTGSGISRQYARTMARATLRGASRVVALTQREATYLEGLGVPGELLRVIPNGIDLEEFRDLPPPEPHTSLRILSVGRIYPRQKGLDTLVEAFGRMTGRGPAELRLVGEDWGGQAVLQANARRLGVADRVHFTGPVARARLLQEYASCDLFVLPSRFEPFGIVLLEAMASGKPIVASRTGGIPEVVEDGRSAMLVPPGDPEALAAAMRAVGEDPERRERMGRAGKERVLRFAWPTLAPKFLQLFEEVAHDDRSGRRASIA
jgi:glycosyltransferase involved in cell wall biosynthesis